MLSLWALTVNKVVIDNGWRGCGREPHVTATKNTCPRHFELHAAVDWRRKRLVGEMAFAVVKRQHWPLTIALHVHRVPLTIGCVDRRQWDVAVTALSRQAVPEPNRPIRYLHSGDRHDSFNCRKSMINFISPSPSSRRQKKTANEIKTTLINN